MDTLQITDIRRNKVQPVGKPFLLAFDLDIGNLVYHRKRKCSIFIVAFNFDRQFYVALHWSFQRLPHFCGICVLQVGKTFIYFKSGHLFRFVENGKSKWRDTKNYVFYLVNCRTSNLVMPMMYQNTTTYRGLLCCSHAGWGMDCSFTVFLSLFITTLKAIDILPT